MSQMTVVEAYVGQKKIDPPEDGLQYHSTVSSLLNEGIAQNTAGSVFSSKVLKILSFVCVASSFIYLLILI